MRRGRFLLLFSVFLVLLLPLGACRREATPAPSTPTPAAEAKEAPNPAPTPPRAAGRPLPPRAGAAAYPFTLSDLAGNEVSLSDLRGQKVLVNFWAPWCGPCRIEIPALVKAYAEYHDQGLEIVAINMLEDPQRVAAFVEQFGMSFPVLLDRDGKVAQSYFVRGIPTSVFVDEEGIIQAVHVGLLTESMLRNYLVELFL